MVTIKQFFEKYLSYVLLGVFAFLSFYIIISNLLTIENLKNLFNTFNNSYEDENWSLIADWFIELFAFIVVLILSIIVLATSNKVSKIKRLFAFNSTSLMMSIIMFALGIGTLLIVIEFADRYGSSNRYASSIYSLVFSTILMLSAAIIILISLFVKKGKFVLTSIGYFISFVIFINSSLNLITVSQNSQLVSVGSQMQFITLIIISFIGFVLSMVHMAINYTSPKVAEKLDETTDL